MTAAGSVHALCPLKAKLELSIVVSVGATSVPPLSVTVVLVNVVALVASTVAPLRRR